MALRTTKLVKVFVQSANDDFMDFYFCIIAQFYSQVGVSIFVEPLTRVHGDWQDILVGGVCAVRKEVRFEKHGARGA